MHLAPSSRICFLVCMFLSHLTFIASQSASSYVRRSSLELDEFDVKNCSATDYSYCNSKGGFQFSQSPCNCKCNHDAYSYVVSENKCISNAEIQGECKFSISKRLGVSYTGLRAFVLPYGRTRVYYCRDAENCEDLVNSCVVSYNGSSYDAVDKWKPLWSSQSQVVFGAYPADQRDLSFTGTRECEGSQYDGMLLRLQLTCQNSSGFAISSCLVLKVASIYEFGNRDGDEPSEKTACPAPTQTPAPVTTDRTTPSTATHTEYTSTLPTDTTLPVTSYTTSPSNSTIEPTTTRLWTTVEGNSTANPNVTAEPTTGWQGSTAAITTSSSTNSTALLIVAVVLGVVLLCSCLVIGYLCLKWRTAKQRQRRMQWSDRINPYSMHYLDSKHRPSEIFLVEGCMRSATPLSNTLDLMNAAEQPYNEPMDSAKPNAFRHIYAAVDKFRGKSKRSSNLSLDEGYTSTDDIGNYDYRKFSAFPRDLYDNPGDVVPNDEPDYRIPEDFIARIAARTPDFATFRQKQNAKRMSMENLYDEPNSPSEVKSVNPPSAQRVSRISRSVPLDPFTGEPIYYEAGAGMLEAHERKRSRDKVQPPIPPRPRSQLSYQDTVVSTASLIGGGSGSADLNSASEGSDLAESL